MIDIDQFLEKEIKKKKEQELKLDFLADVELTLNKIKEKVSSSPIEKINTYYKEIFGFEKELKGKFLSIENTTHQVLNTLVYDFYEKKYIEDIKIFRKKKEEFEKKVNELEEDLNKKEIKKALTEYTEAITVLNTYPDGFFEERFKDLKRLGKIYEKLSQYIKIDIEKTKKEILTKFKIYLKEIISSLKEKDYLKLEKEILNLEKLISEIPKSLSSDFLDYEEKANKLLIIAKDILFRYHQNRFDYLEKEITENIGRFKIYIKEDNLKDAFLTYNVILNLFKRLPDFFLEKKKSLFEKIVDLYSDLNTLILKENIMFFSSQEKIGFLLSNFEEYYYLININPKYYSQEKVNKIINVLKRINSSYSKILLDKFKKYIDTKMLELDKEKENKSDKGENKRIENKKEIKVEKEEEKEELEKKKKILLILQVKKLLQELDKIRDINKYKKVASVIKKEIIKLDVSTNIKNRLLEELEEKIEHKKRELEVLRKLKLKKELENIEDEIINLKKIETKEIKDIKQKTEEIITKIKISQLNKDTKKRLVKILEKIYIEKVIKIMITKKPELEKAIIIYKKVSLSKDKEEKKTYLNTLNLLIKRLNLTIEEIEILKKYFNFLKEELSKRKNNE